MKGSGQLKECSSDPPPWSTPSRTSTPSPQHHNISGDNRTYNGGKSNNRSGLSTDNHHYHGALASNPYYFFNKEEKKQHSPPQSIPLDNHSHQIGILPTPPPPPSQPIVLGSPFKNRTATTTINNNNNNTIMNQNRTGYNYGCSTTNGGGSKSSRPGRRRRLNINSSLYRLMEDEPITVETVRSKIAKNKTKIKILLVGCTHGKLDRIYDVAREYDKQNTDRPIDMILCPGDFQSVRDRKDMDSLVTNINRMEDFHKYYEGHAEPSHLTIFTGGNHECSQYLWETEDGGYISKDIYYLGRCGVVKVKGVRILGFGGIFNQRHVKHGFFEQPPWNNNNMRSIYHQRLWDVARVRSLAGSLDIINNPIDVVLSHDWPRCVTGGGDYRRHISIDETSVDILKKKKTLFKDEIDEYRFSSPLLDELYLHFTPVFWGAAHFHVNYENELKLDKHPASDNIDTYHLPKTIFVALDKPDNYDVSYRIIEVWINSDDYNDGIELDPEWLMVAGQWEQRGIPRMEGRIPYDVIPDRSLLPDEVSFVKDLLRKLINTELKTINTARPVIEDLRLISPVNNPFPYINVADFVRSASQFIRRLIKSLPNATGSYMDELKRNYLTVEEENIDDADIPLQLLTDEECNETPISQSRGHNTTLIGTSSEQLSSQIKLENDTDAKLSTTPTNTTSIDNLHELIPSIVSTKEDIKVSDNHTALLTGQSDIKLDIYDSDDNSDLNNNHSSQRYLHGPADIKLDMSSEL